MVTATRSFRASLAAMLGICLAFMLIALNTSVVGTAMPRIVAELRGYEWYQWSASAFLLGNAVTIPIAGRLGDLYGRKPFVLWAVVLFTLASVACGLAQTMVQLVLCRAGQGLAGGMLLGVASACVPDLFPDPAQRVRWQVMLSSSYGFALAVGPSIGGWLAEHMSWRLVFFINIPVAIAALVMVGAYFPHVIHHEEQDRRIDWLGALWLLLAVSGLLVCAEFGQGHGLFNFTELALCTATAVATWAFFRHQYHTGAPIIPPAVLDNAGAQKLMALGTLTGVSMFMLIFYTPLLLQGSFGQSPNQAGLVMTPLLVFITIGSILNGRLLPRLRRAERLIAWGQFGTLASCLMLLFLNAETSKVVMMLVFGLCGLSLGFQLPNLTLQLMSVCGRSHLGVAGALAQSTRMIGSMIGVGIASMAVNAVYTLKVDAALSALHVTDTALLTLLASPQVLIRQQDQTALLAQAQHLGVRAEPMLHAARLGLESGTHLAFVLCALIAGLSILISLRLPRYAIATQRARGIDSVA